MGLFINCYWHAPKSALSERVALAVGLFGAAELNVLTGARWYCTSHSKKGALSKEVSNVQLRNLENWRHVGGGDGSGYFGLRIWNGSDAASFSAYCEVSEATSRGNTFVVSGPTPKQLRAAGVEWSSILSCGDVVAQLLGGIAVVSSSEIVQFARDNATERPDLAAYAAFWGPDRSGTNPDYAVLPSREVAPFSMVVARTWDDVDSPPLERTAELIQFLQGAR